MSDVARRLASSVTARHSISLSSVRPWPVTALINTCGTSAGSVSDKACINSSSSMSLLLMASTRCLSINWGLKCCNSRNRMLYCSVMSSASAGTINSNTALRSMCRRKRSPRPRPSLAPSMMPGMSAMTKERPSRYSTIPNWGSIVVNG